MYTQDKQLRTLLIVAHAYYMRGVHQKRQLKYTEKAGAIDSWLLYVVIDSEVIHCIERFNRDVLVYNLEN